ncbi:hypothetical protein MMC22_001302 [Lobaria immixta]|nr:hypothetical protein [Lobaria immixta]
MPSPPDLHSSGQDSKAIQRSQAEALLPPSFDPSSQETLSTPVPEKDRKAYTIERFQKNLEYCQEYLARPNISPRSETFMMVFKDELKVAIQAENEDNKLAGAVTIGVFEHLIRRNAFLKAEVFTESQEIQQNLLELGEVQYDSRYGDYVKLVPARIHIHASETKMEKWQLLCGQFQWSEISERLSREHALSRDGHKRQEGPCGEESAAMEFLDLDTHYGKRNQTFHGDLDSLKADGNFGQFALVLYTDLEDIDCAFSEIRSETDKDALKSFIYDEINRWFDNTFDPKDVNAWIAQARADRGVQGSKGYEGTRPPRQRKRRLISPKSSAEARAEKPGSQVFNIGIQKEASAEEPRGLEDESAKRSADRRRQFLVQIC